MKQIHAYLLQKQRQMRNYYPLLLKESKLKTLFITLFVFCWFFFSYYIFKRAFVFLLAFPFFGPILIDRIFHLYFFVLFLMLIISSIILTLSAVFSSKETEFLLIQPILVEKVLFLKFLGVTWFSSWAFVFLSVPVFLSIAMVKGINIIMFVCLSGLLLIPFIIIASAIGFIFSEIIIEYFWNFIGKLIFLILFIAVTYSVFLVYPDEPLRISAGISAFTDRIMGFTVFSTKPYFPSTWFSGVFLILLGAEKTYLWVHLQLIISFFFFCIVFLLFINNQIGNRVISKYYSFGSKKYTFSLYENTAKCLSLVRKIPRDVISIVSKDIQILVRDPVQYLQFLIFFGLLTFYVFNIKNMHYNIESAFWKNLITYLNLCSVCLTLGTLTTRFWFPQISLEGKRHWIIGMSQISFKRLIFIKFIYVGTISVFITVFITFLSNNILGAYGFNYYLTIFTAFLAGINLSSLAIGFGGIFPNFHADNSAAIVSGFGGTLTLILSVLYVIVFVVCHGITGHLFVVGVINEVMHLYIQLSIMFIHAIYTILVSKLLLEKATLNLENMEF